MVLGKKEIENKQPNGAYVPLKLGRVIVFVVTIYLTKNVIY